MLTQTSELAIRSLIFLALEGQDEPVSPTRMAEALDCSPSYLAKTMGMLVRAGILRSVRGAHGGVLLARSPEEIDLLSIVEACQGLLIANYCSELSVGSAAPRCSFHRAMEELFSATVQVLSKWSVKDLLSTPMSPKKEALKTCKMAFEGCELYIHPSKMDKKRS